MLDGDPMICSIGVSSLLPLCKSVASHVMVLWGRSRVHSPARQPLFFQILFVFKQLNKLTWWLQEVFVYLMTAGRYCLLGWPRFCCCLLDDWGWLFTWWLRAVIIYLMTEGWQSPSPTSHNTRRQTLAKPEQMITTRLMDIFCSIYIKPDLKPEVCQMRILLTFGILVMEFLYKWYIVTKTSTRRWKPEWRSKALTNWILRFDVWCNISFQRTGTIPTHDSYVNYLIKINIYKESSVCIFTWIVTIIAREESTMGAFSLLTPSIICDNCILYWAVWE